MGLLPENSLLPVTANAKMLAQSLKVRQQPRTQLTGQGLLDTAAIGLSPVPVIGDAIGLAADASRYINDPSSRTPLNFGLTALGMLPFVPPATAIFAGPLAKTAKLDQKAIAEGMEKAGRSRDDIWKETGWFKGPEGKWKFEIDDSGAQLNKHLESGAVNRWSAGDGINVKETMSHDPLYSAYPDIAKIPTQGRVTSDLTDFIDQIGGVKSSTLGGYGPDGIVLNSPLSQTKSTLLHELQHGVQNLEGFQRGGNPAVMAQKQSEVLARINFLNSELSAAAKGMDKFPKGSPQYQEFRKTYDAAMDEKLSINPSLAQGNPHDAYRSLAGEAEARAVQSRMNMTQQQRQQTPPWQSYDVPWDRLIIK